MVGLYFWTLLIAKPLLLMGGFMFLPRSILPIKAGWKQDNQKLIAKGTTLFLLGLGCLLLFLFIMTKG